MFNISSVMNWLGFGNNKNMDMNSLTVLDYYERLKLIGLSMYEWENLPESCNAMFLEKTLFTYGRAIFINDPKTGFLNMRCTPSGELNHYDEPVSYTAYSTIYNEQFDRDNCVLVRNNYLERPTDNTIMLFAKRLAEVERTIDINVNAQKTPVLLSCDDKDRLTLKNIYSQYSGNEPVIIGSKAINIDVLKVLKTDAPYVVDKLQIYKRDLMNEVLTFYGVDNANTDKRERLITDEANANNEHIDIGANIGLLTRKEACVQLKKLYGIEPSVKKRIIREEEIISILGGEGKKDGEIYG